MATEEEREATLSDKSKHRTFTDIFFSQKQSFLFCDVVLKVCSREIHAHSNILAAASPYFEHFLSQDLPRQFSQRSPQIIEIQIDADGTEPNVFYEDAVDRVIDFVYTGYLTVKECNVAQIYEISKIMDIDKIICFCEDFIQGKVQHDTTYQAIDGSQTRSVMSNTDITSVKYGSMLDFWSSITKSSRVAKDAALLSKIKSRKVTSVAVQTVPVVPISLNESKTSQVAFTTNNDSTGSTVQDENVNRVHKHTGVVTLKMKTRFSRKRGRPAKTKNAIEQQDIGETSPKKLRTSEPLESSDISQEVPGVTVSSIDGIRVVTTRSGRKVIPKNFDGEIFTASTKVNEIIHNIKLETVDSIETYDELTEASSCDESRLNPKPADTGDELLDLCLEAPAKEVDMEPGNVLTEKLEPMGVEGGGEARADGMEICDDVNAEREMNDFTDNEASETNAVHIVISSNNVQQPNKTGAGDPIFLPLKRVDQPEYVNTGKKHGCAKKYVCPDCEFETGSVRDMTSHAMDHKMDNKQCFYCDLTIEDREELLLHVRMKHTSPVPFLCRLCGARFKTRTMLNLHLPKHSHDKPYICEVCSMGFKWKHALTSHMNTHSLKKEHLCDICGYTTAWKAQLKSHKLIHQGNTFKCNRPGCRFETTKKQNLKNHDITHTGERKNVCDICGQTFSLKRNMRRHMLLHFSSKEHRCTDCEFASTRYDKLKEHMFKQHAKGTPPERRMKISEFTQQHNLTINPSGQFISAPDQVEVWKTDVKDESNLILATEGVTGQFISAPDPDQVQVWTTDINQESNLILSTEGVTGMGSTNHVSEADLTTVTQSGNVIAVIKDTGNDTYAILNNILNGSSDRNVIIQSEDGQRLQGLSQFTAQQVLGDDENAIEQLVTDHQFVTHDTSTDQPQTYQIISQDALQLSDNTNPGEQTFHILDADNKMQLIKIQDLAEGVNLSNALCLGPGVQILREGEPSNSITTTQDTSPDQDLSHVPTSYGEIDTPTDSKLSQVPTSYGQIVVEPYTTSQTLTTSKESMLIHENESLESQVVIQGPDGSQVPVQVVEPI